MAVFGFTLPHFMNKLLRHTVEKDKLKQKTNNDFSQRQFQNDILYKNLQNWMK